MGLRPVSVHTYIVDTQSGSLVGLDTVTAYVCVRIIFLMVQK